MAPEPRIERLSLGMIAAGLVGRSEKSGKPYDRFRHRLIFPIRNGSGRLVGFGGGFPLVLWWRRVEELPGPGEVFDASAICKEAVMANAVET